MPLSNIMFVTKKINMVWTIRIIKKKNAPDCIWFPVEDIKISDMFYKIKKV